MNPIKKIILSITMILFLLAIVNPISSAEDDQVITDSTNDVIYTDYANALSDEEELISNTSRPNVDIVTMTYMHQDGSSEVTVIMEVLGNIEDANDFETMDVDDLNFSGKTINYGMELTTSTNMYSIDYIDGNCTVNGEDTTYERSGSDLTVTFNLEESSETFVSLTGYTTEIDVVSIMQMDMKIYMDIAPDESLFIAYIDAPETGSVGEELTFEAEYDDLLAISTPPYTYTWDWDDGTADGSGPNPTHSFDLPATYTVELTIEDASGLSATTTQEITISQGSGNNNNNNGDNGNGDTSDDGEGSGFILFIGVVAIIVIIGVIALIVVIRR